MTVQELLGKVVTKMGSAPPQTVSFLDAVNATLDIIGRVLLQKQSNLLRAYDSIVTVEANSLYPLPDGFWGMMDEPYFKLTGSNSVIFLSPTTADEVYSYDGMVGQPEKYELSGEGDIKLFPEPDGVYTVKLAYAAKASVSDLSDSLPYGGLFDSLIEDAVVKVGIVGGWASAAPDWFYIESGINLLLRARSPRRITTVNARSTWA